MGIPFSAPKNQQSKPNFSVSLSIYIQQINTAKMAEMMFFMKKNKEKAAVKAYERQTKAELKDVLITDTAETSIRKQQFERDQGWKEQKRETKSNLKDVNMAVASFEGEVRKEQHQREKDFKETVRNTMSDLKDVVITDTAEGSIRKEQFDRDQGMKQTSRETKSNLKDVNMVVATYEG